MEKNDNEENEKKIILGYRWGFNNNQTPATCISRGRVYSLYSKQL